MSPEIYRAPDVRSKYAFLFGCIAELYRFHYDRKPSTKFDDIKAAVEEMRKDGFLSDYLIANLESLFAKYPELMPGKFQTDDFLFKLAKSLDMVNGDLCAEIAELAQSSRDYDEESLLRWLNGGKVD